MGGEDGPPRLSSRACALHASRTTRTCPRSDAPSVCSGRPCFSRPIPLRFRPACPWRGRSSEACSPHCFRAQEQLALKSRTLAASSKCGVGSIHTVRECNSPEGAGDTRPHDCRLDHRRDMDHRPWPDRPDPGMDKTQRDAAALKRRLNTRRRSAAIGPARRTPACTDRGYRPSAP